MPDWGRPPGWLCLAFCLLLMPASCSAPPPANPPEVRTVALLYSVRTENSTTGTSLRQALANNGYVEGENLLILGDRDGEVYPDEDDVRTAVRGWRDRGVEIIIAFSTSAARIAAEEAPDARVLFLANDPVATGLVDNPIRPEGRLTGVTYKVPADRTLQIAGRIVPNLTTVGLPYPPSDPAALPSRVDFETTAASLGMQLLTEEFADASDLPRAVAALAARGAQLLLLSVSPTATRAAEQLAEAADRAGLPMVANIDVSTIALFTLRPDSDALNLQLASQAVRLLNGDPVADLPVENPRRFILVVNEKVAHRFGIEVPEDVLREVHHVIR